MKNRVAVAISAYSTLPGCGFPFDDCNAYSRLPNYPTSTLLHASGATRGPGSGRREDIACRSTGRWNGPAKGYSFGTTSVSQRGCGCTLSTGLLRAHESTVLQSAAYGHCALRR